mgnify:CR=1 FL=1
MGILDTLHDGAFSNDDPLRDAYLKMKSDETAEKVEVPEVESDTEKQVITENTVNAKIQMAPVGKEDGDVDNAGDRDSSDKYPVSYNHLRAHETYSYLVCRLLLATQTSAY